MCGMDYDSSIYTPEYTIRDVACFTGVSPNLIRIYEREGLIRPCRDPVNNYRLFTADDVEWIKKIKCLLKHVGLNLQGIKAIMTINPCWDFMGCTDEQKSLCPVACRDTCENCPCWNIMEENNELRPCYKCRFYVSARNHPKFQLKMDNFRN